MVGAATRGHGYFREDFTEIHGLTWVDVQYAPEFPFIAPEFLERLTRADLVIAHNAPFDIRVLRGTLEHYRLTGVEFDYFCTCRAARRVWPELPSHSLDALAAHIGHEFHQRHAQADAEAAGRVLLARMKHANATSPSDFLREAGMAPQRFRE